MGSDDIEGLRVDWKTEEAKRKFEENRKKHPNLKLHCLICPKVDKCPYNYNTIECDENKRRNHIKVVELLKEE